MLRLRLFSSLVLAIGLSLSFAIELLPRAKHAAVESPAFARLHEVAFNNSDRPDDTPLPLLNLRTHAPQNPLVTTSLAAVQVKRMLLSPRQTCSVGYDYCSSKSKFPSQRSFRPPQPESLFMPNTSPGSDQCCPSPEFCCDGGYCATSTQICCLTGGPCDADQQCCEDGCHPIGNICCSNGGSCDPGYSCCGNDSCSPPGGQCCENGQVCGTGLLCVIFNGKYGCCKNLRCDDFDDEGFSSIYETLSELLPSYSLKVPAYTPEVSSISSPTSTKSSLNFHATAHELFPKLSSVTLSPTSSETSIDFEVSLNSIVGHLSSELSLITGNVLPPVATNPAPTRDVDPVPPSLTSLATTQGGRSEAGSLKEAWGAKWKQGGIFVLLIFWEYMI